MFGIKLNHHSTAVSVAVIYAAMIVNILLGWVLAKLNTQYLTVAEYGRYAFFMIFIFLSRSFFGFGVFESTSRLLAVSRDEHIQRQFLGTGTVLTLGFIIPFAFWLFLASFFADQIFEVQIADLLSFYALLSGLVLLHTFLTLALRGTGWINMMALMTVLPRVIYLMLLIAVIYAGSFNLQATMNMFFAGYIITLAGGLIYIKPDPSAMRIRIREIIDEVRTYGVHLYVSNIWYEIFFHADKFIVSLFLSEESMAYYALGYMITFPLSHFSTALSTTFFRRFSGQLRIDKRLILFNAGFLILSVLGFILLREFIIMNLFSDRYLPTIDIIIPLSLAFGFSGFSKPFTLYLMARKWGKIVRNISVVVPVVHIGVSIWLIPLYGIYGAAWLATVVYFLDMLLYVLAYIKIMRNSPDQGNTDREDLLTEMARE